MRSSRGMGDVAPTKQPQPKTLRRKDDPQIVQVYRKGGSVQPKPAPRGKK